MTIYTEYVNFLHLEHCGITFNIFKNKERKNKPFEINGFIVSTLKLLFFCISYHFDFVCYNVTNNNPHFKITAK